MTKLHDLPGKIISKELRKVYNKKSQYRDNAYYKLAVLMGNNTQTESLFVYPNLVTKKIFATIEKSQYIDKRFLFFCEKKPKRWVLHNWEELNSHEKS